MNGNSRVAFLALSASLACVGRQHVEVATGAEQSASAANDSESNSRTEPDWRSLAEIELAFVPPEPLATKDMPGLPTELPPTHDGPLLAIEQLPIVIWPNLALPCQPRPPISYCSHQHSDKRGTQLSNRRIDYVGEQMALIVDASPDRGASTLERCWYDGTGRVIKRQRQRSERAASGCPVWNVSTTRLGYDELGGPVFVEELNERYLPGRPEPSPGESGTTIYRPTYEDGSPTHLATFDTSPDFDYADLSYLNIYVWEADRISRIDSFDASGAWNASKVFTWSGNLLRVDWFKPSNPSATAGSTVRIYEHRGPDSYVPIYETPETHWEYAVVDGVESSSKFVGELLVERRRFSVDGDERRPLTVEQLVPDVEGLAVVESWDWSQGSRVTVDRPEGRDIYWLDCSALPPIESLVDPDCPPPEPLR